MKKYNAPSLKVRSFNRESILTGSTSDPTTAATNVENATAALTGQGGVPANQVVTVTL